MIAVLLTAIAVTAMFSVVLTSLTTDKKSDYRLEAALDLKRAADAMRAYVISSDTAPYYATTSINAMSSLVINTGSPLFDLTNGPCNLDSPLYLTTGQAYPFSNTTSTVFHNLKCLANEPNIATSFPAPANVTFIYRVATTPDSAGNGTITGLGISSVTFELNVPTAAN